MNEQPTTFQQQVLFEESNDPNIVLQPTDLPEQQLIIDNQAWQAQDDLLMDEPTSTELPGHKPRWLLRGLLLLSAIVLITNIVQFFIIGFAESPIITSLYAVIFAGISIFSGAAITRELVSLRQLKLQHREQHQAAELLRGEQVFDVEKFCQKITNQLPSDLMSELDVTFQSMVEQAHSEQELLQLYDRIVLAKIDQRAVAEIAKFASETTVLIALSPVAIIDMLLMFWRNMRMVNKIASLYGLQLGYWSRLSLLKQVLINMVYAGGSELITDLGTDLLGAELLGKFSARLAQGAGAGLLTARLGIKTITLCRPIPSFDSKPNMAHIRQSMYQQVKALAAKAR